MKRKILIACVILLSVVLLGCLMFIVKMEHNLAEPPETVTTGETGSGETVGTDEPGVSTQNTNPDTPPEATTTAPEDTVQTQPQETTPPATTKPVETTKPAESTASTDEKLDPDELPLVPNK